MTFALILAVMGILAFVISENYYSLILIVFACNLAYRSFENLKEKVEWLEIQLKEREG